MLLDILFMFLLGSRLASSWCPKETPLSEYSGTFSSPNHKDLYPDNQQCTWYITAPHASLHVKLTFSSFHLEDCKNCQCDSVTIYDVTEDKKNITLGKYCGQKNPGTFYSSGRYMIVVFKSDNGDSHSGFLAHYQTNIQQGSVCNPSGVLLSESGGALTTPDSPSNYPSRSKCIWLIKTQPDYRIKFKFLNFDLENCSAAPGRCQCDYVEVRDGNSSSSFLLGRFCGSVIPSELFSSNRYLWIQFVSDSQVNKIGFVAEYTTRQNEKCSCPKSWKYPFRCPKIYWKASENSSSVCCFDNGPNCCEKGGKYCSDSGKDQRNYCPRPSDDKKKTRCCMEKGKPSCCLSDGNFIEINRLLLLVVLLIRFISLV